VGQAPEYIEGSDLSRVNPGAIAWRFLRLGKSDPSVWPLPVVVGEIAAKDLLELFAP